MFFNKSEEIERLNTKYYEQEIDLGYYKNIAEARTKDCEQSSIAYEKLHDKYECLRDKYTKLDDNYDALQHKYLNIIRKYNDQNAKYRLRKTELSESENQVLVLLALLTQSKKLDSVIFFKNRLDENLNGENDKFNLYLIKLDSEIYITWKLDVKYWDLFLAPIDIPSGFKEVDNVTELLNDSEKQIKKEKL